MAIGLGRMLGFPYPENQDPSLATTVRTSGGVGTSASLHGCATIFTFPLAAAGGADVRTYFNLLITMAIGGLWHGASWAFLFGD